MKPQITHEYLHKKSTRKVLIPNEKIFPERNSPYSHRNLLPQTRYKESLGRGTVQMLRIYCLHSGFHAATPQRESLYDMASMRGFAGTKLGNEHFPENIVKKSRRLCELNLQGRENLNRGKRPSLKTVLGRNYIHTVPPFDEKPGTESECGHEILEEGKPALLRYKDTRGIV